jgi:hypothetical protein
MGSGAERLSLEEIEDQRLRRMLAYWQSKVAPGRLPDRRDIDPSDFRWALGLVCLLDVEHRPLRFRYRLDGSLIVSRNGLDMTGRPLDEIGSPPQAGMLQGHFGTVVVEKAPVAHRIVTDCAGAPVAYERLSLPLAKDGDEVAMIMTVAANSEIEQTQHIRCFFR